jgi:hypothetical protein
LALVDVIALNSKRGVFGPMLSKSDFQVYDDGRRVPIGTFDTGATARPLAVWFVSRCNQQQGQTKASGLSAGSVSLLKSALTQLHSEDLIGVAHWCDDGTSLFDLLPTRDANDVIQALEQVLTPTATSSSLPRLAASGFWIILHSVIDNTLALKPERVPLVILLNEEGTIPTWQADYLSEQLLRTSTTVYALKSSPSPRSRRPKWGERENVLIADFLASETGGQVVSVAPSAFGNGLKLIFNCAHSRYELGFIPAVLDGKRHSLRITLSPAAKTQHRRVRLGYRDEYFADRNR